MVAFRQYPIIGLMGSGTSAVDDPAAEALGQAIAMAGCHLLTGAGAGVMTAAARGFCSVESRQGQSIGIIPAKSVGSVQSKPGYPNRFIEIPIRTHLITASDPQDAASRNPINVLTAHGLIFRHGGPGTASELMLAEKYDRPVLIFLKAGERIGTFDTATLRHFGPVTDDIEAARTFIAEVVQGVALSTG